jgi:hypothetical protein
MAQQIIENGTQVFKNIREAIDNNATDVEARLPNSTVIVKTAADYGK